MIESYAVGRCLVVWRPWAGDVDTEAPPDDEVSCVLEIAPQIVKVDIPGCINGQGDVTARTSTKRMKGAQVLVISIGGDISETVVGNVTDVKGIGGNIHGNPQHSSNSQTGLKGPRIVYIRVALHLTGWEGDVKCRVEVRKQDVLVSQGKWTGDSSPTLPNVHRPLGGEELEAPISVGSEGIGLDGARSVGVQIC